MKKLLLLLLYCMFVNTIFGQDTIKNSIKFSSEFGSLFKGDGLTLSKIGYERYLTSHSSLTLWLGNEFTSTNLILNNIESVVNCQNIRSDIDYKWYLERNQVHIGLFLLGSFCFSLSMTNQDNERSHSLGAKIGIGYSYPIKRFIIDLYVYKDYSYSVLTNDNIKYISSTINSFNYEISIAYTF